MQEIESARIRRADEAAKIEAAHGEEMRRLEHEERVRELERKAREASRIQTSSFLERIKQMAPVKYALYRLLLTL